jgi:hypothetical protein
MGLVLLACAAVGGTALAAPATGGRHLPYFSLLNERVAVQKLPFGLRFSFGQVLPGEIGRNAEHPTPGPVWFGQVERPNATILAAGNRRKVCETEKPKNDLQGSGGTCTTLGAARELFDLTISSCGKGPARHYRIHGLVPNGVTGLEIEKSDGTMGRTVPVTRNTFSFEVGLEDFTLHGVGSAAAELLERRFPLAGTAGRGENRAGCVSVTFAEAKGGG